MNEKREKNYPKTVTYYEQPKKSSSGKNCFFVGYSSVPNSRVGQNKRAGGKILKKYLTCRPK